MKDSRPIVYIVDDDEPVRDAIGMLLDTVEIPHRSYASASEFLDDLDAGVPGCLLLDIRMPGMNGLELQTRLGEEKRPIPIIFITGHGDVPMAVDAMKRGALDFIRKPFRDQELLDAVEQGLQAATSELAAAHEQEELHARFEQLTPREREVFDRVADGQANKVVAIDLGISERTVEIHRSQAMHKMGARSLAELVRMKLRLGR
jgi:FixJ family two-component response regulator